MSTTLSNNTNAIKDSLAKTAEFILSIQTDAGAIPWFKDGKLDPWDHTEAAMGLSTMGHHNQAKQAYLWLDKNQLADGSWHASFNKSDEYTGQSSDTDIRETNFIAYVATGVWHHFLISNDKDFLRQMYPCVKAAINLITNHQSLHGEVAWAIDHKGESKNDALITACASILRSIECACSIGRALNECVDSWHSSANRLKTALLEKPERFDRTWESKKRFSMDWYYPILAGIHSQENAQAIMHARWSEFIVDGLGCRCVNDEPWVTMAETCELVMALIASGKKCKAGELFDNLNQWRDKDGGYWTGYVYRDKAIWPDEKTTWTAGAVILAADALFDLTPAAHLFTKPLFVGI